MPSQTFKNEIDKLERSGYLPTYKDWVRNCCVPFWWAAKGSDGRFKVIHNGTIVFVQTDSRLIGVTAGHVYEQYLQDKERSDISCQFGQISLMPEEIAIDSCKSPDLAAFDCSAVLVAGTGAVPHVPVSWPIPPSEMKVVALCGGYPGKLRVDKTDKVEMDFQTLIGALADVTMTGSLIFNTDPAQIHWPLHPAGTLNTDLGGMSGGPVFRFIPAPPATIERIELAGFIYEHNSSLNVMRAHPASCIASDGSIIR